MYVAVKGGEAAIANAHRLLADRRRGDRSVPSLRIEQIVEQLALGVDRVMSEGSLYDRELAALAIMQSRGDLIEAIFLVRAYRTTLPRFGYTRPIDTATPTACSTRNSPPMPRWPLLSSAKATASVWRVCPRSSPMKG
jgi:alpha-D-ribose 1-methylphosphonate 5-triphosphate synthase subunit PhnI